jgi:predicted RNA-binding Zn-ribbon protein involved in translation (DUF1610 family)
MRLRDAEWTPEINLLLIDCDCGQRIKHRADRWKVRCPACGREDNLHRLREDYVRQRKQSELEYRLPKIFITTEIVIKESNEVIASQFEVRDSDLPRSVMDDIKQLIGDGNARVTVSADFGIKDYGTGASAMASVSLTCNQDQQTIERAARIAGDLARDFAQEQRARAEQEFEALMAQRGGAQAGGPGYGG